MVLPVTQLHKVGAYLAEVAEFALRFADNAEIYLRAELLVVGSWPLYVCMYIKRVKKVKKNLNGTKNAKNVKKNHFGQFWQFWQF